MVDNQLVIDRTAIRSSRTVTEDDYMVQLLDSWATEAIAHDDIEAEARALIQIIQSKQGSGFSIENLWVEYDLSGQAGADLLCLAEALLRIPDATTRRRFVADRVKRLHLTGGKTPSWLSEFSTIGLGISKLLLPDQEKASGMIAGLSTSVTDTVISKFVTHMAKYFILAETFEGALEKAATLRRQFGYGFSFDMLGEAAYTEADAQRYFQAYRNALEALVQTKEADTAHQGISIKLSAITTRYEFAQRERVVPVLVSRVGELAVVASQKNVTIIIDAEEADCLELTLDVLDLVYQHPSLVNYSGLGIAIQAYQKRAPAVIRWLADLAKRYGKRLPCRLVKGAYWDTEIKLAQVHGLPDYDVLTRKSNTDLNFLHCAKILKTHADSIYPQFATHNAQTIVAIKRIMGHQATYEFQRLFGMGEVLFNHLAKSAGAGESFSIYAPVGAYKDLLPYLARRMLENGANTSFVHQIAKQSVDVSGLVEHPIKRVQSFQSYQHPNIPKPGDLYWPRKNSLGCNLNDHDSFMNLKNEGQSSASQLPQTISSLVAFRLAKSSDIVSLSNPSFHDQIITHCYQATQSDVDQAIGSAVDAFDAWSTKQIADRSAYLRQTADLLEAKRSFFCWLLIKESGKTWSDAVDEVREAVDFLRYYADEAEDTLATVRLPGPTGEDNSLVKVGRGVFVCISPWNFPLAIFVGQIAAALVTGNAVIAKPASQTPRVAYEMVKLFHRAGVSAGILQLLLGSVKVVGERLIGDDRIAGVMLTGSTQTAQVINRALANRPGPIVPLIAETGGQNVMIVDSTALLEQVITDVIDSAFQSAGQRCSALRVLLLQADIADDAIEMLSGAMKTLVVGDPEHLSTDIGPVIDQAQYNSLIEHVAYLETCCRPVGQVSMVGSGLKGCFFRPIAYEIPDLSILKQEIFGPILHVMRYRHEDILNLCDDINAMAYGLTFGVHTRIESFYQMLSERIRVGNVYVNRNIIGAQVGVQPFGGQGLSGTGPKAGGPFYLTRLCQEKTISNNTAALGGNASLMSLED